MGEEHVNCLVKLQGYQSLCFDIQKTIFRPGPTAWTSQAWRCLQCGSQLAGGTPPGPPGTHALSQFWYTCFIPVLVHIFNPSFLTHLSSHGTAHCCECCALVVVTAVSHTFFIYSYFLISVLVYFFHLNHQFYTQTCTYTTALTSLGHALPGASPWSPQCTFFIPVLVHMFNLCFATNFLFLSYQTYTLACTNGMALAALSQLARGKPLGPPSPHV